MKSRVGLLAVGIGIATPLCGSTAWPRPHEPTRVEADEILYAESPGRMEFSGRMLVRPLQAQGRPGFEEQDLLARALLEPDVVEYFEDLDIYVVNVPAGSTENAYGAELLSTGLYEYVRPDWVLFPLGSPNDPDYPLQWHLPKISAPGAWRFTTGNPAVVVAFVDTGVDLAHPDLASLVVPGCNAHSSARGQPIYHDDNGHGTSVAGAGIAVANNGSGGCGVGWQLRIMPIRATNPGSSSGGASSSDIIWGARWAANRGAKVVNCSWTGVAEPSVESLGQYVRARGALLVWPMDALDDPPHGTTFDHPNVLVVNGTTPQDTLFPPANWGPGVDIAAPALGLWIPVKGGGYNWRDGNSFAAPIAAACAGLIWSLNTSLTSLQVEHALEWSAKDIGAPGQDDYFGHGRVDPYIAAVNVLIGNIGHPHMISSITTQDITNALNQWHVEF